MAYHFLPVSGGDVTFALADFDHNGWKDALLVDLVSGEVTLHRSEGCGRESVFGFRRGDVDGSGALEVTDAIANLAYQLVGGKVRPCLDVLDFDDNGKIELTDPIANLSHQFLGAPSPPAPGPFTCGDDPTADSLPGCEVPCF